MRYMLDTNILIYLLKNRPHSVAARVGSLVPEDSLCMSFVSWAELLRGAERSTQAANVRAKLELLARQVPVLYQANHAMCAHHARLGAALQRAGTPIGSNDLWIASHALAETCTLVTNNLRDFSRVPGLPTENWVDLPASAA